MCRWGLIRPRYDFRELRFYHLGSAVQIRRNELASPVNPKCDRILSDFNYFEEVSEWIKCY